WRPGAHIGVALTLPWVKALGRTSILSGLLQDPSQLDLLHEKMVKYSMHGLDPGVTFPIVNEKLVPEGRPPAYIHDSLDALRETNPTEYARRKKLVEEAIFGCSESHREENAIPSLE